VEAKRYQLHVGQPLEFRPHSYFVDHSNFVHTRLSSILRHAILIFLVTTSQQLKEVNSSSKRWNEHIYSLFLQDNMVTWHVLRIVEIRVVWRRGSWVMVIQLCKERHKIEVQNGCIFYLWVTHQINIKRKVPAVFSEHNISRLNRQKI
jgi:hypothetical protein